MNKDTLELNTLKSPLLLEDSDRDESKYKKNVSDNKIRIEEEVANIKGKPFIKKHWDSNIIWVTT